METTFIENVLKVKIKVDKGGFVPSKAHKDDAGYDLRTPEDFKLYSGSSYIVDTGVHIELPPGTCACIMAKSGLYHKDGIFTFGLIDRGYTGTIRVRLQRSAEPLPCKEFKAGDKIAQLVIIPISNAELVEVAEELYSGERGDNGFGSSGR